MPERLHEVTADYNDLIHAAMRRAKPSSARGDSGIVQWPTAWSDPATGSSPSRQPPILWNSAQTTNSIERQHDEFMRGIKTPTVLPSADASRRAGSLEIGKPCVSTIFSILR